MCRGYVDHSGPKLNSVLLSSGVLFLLRNLYLSSIADTDGVFVEFPLDPVFHWQRIPDKHRAVCGGSVWPQPIFSSGYFVLRFFRFGCQVQSMSVRASLCDVTSVDSIFFFFSLSVQFSVSIRAVLCGCVIFSGGYFVLRFFRFGCQVQSVSVRASLCDVTSADSIFFFFSLSV